MTREEEQNKRIDELQYKLDVLEQIIPAIYDQMKKFGEKQCQIITILKKLVKS